MTETSVEWTLSPSNSRVFRVLAVSYVLVFGGFFLLLGAALCAFVVFNTSSVYGLLAAAVPLLLLLLYSLRTPTRRGGTWRTLRFHLGAPMLVLVSALGAAGYVGAFLVIGRLLLPIFGVLGLGIGLLVGTLGGFHVEGRFDSRRRKLESGTSEVLLARTTDLRPTRIGDVVVIRPRTTEDRRSPIGTVVLPADLFSELRGELLSD